MVDYSISNQNNRQYHKKLLYWQTLYTFVNGIKKNTGNAIICVYCYKIKILKVISPQKEKRVTVWYCG